MKVTQTLTFFLQFAKLEIIVIEVISDQRQASIIKPESSVFFSRLQSQTSCDYCEEMNLFYLSYHEYVEINL